MAKSVAHRYARHEAELFCFTDSQEKAIFSFEYQNKLQVLTQSKSNILIYHDISEGVLSYEKIV